MTVAIGAFNVLYRRNATGYVPDVTSPFFGTAVVCAATAPASALTSNEV